MKRPPVKQREKAQGRSQDPPRKGAKKKLKAPLKPTYGDAWDS